MMNDWAVNVKNTCNSKFDSQLSSSRLLEMFTLEMYKEYLNRHGLGKTWNFILEEIKHYDINSINNTFFKFDDIGEIYEIGLAHTNKIKKKEMGKYYTPTDVAEIMATLLLENDNITSIVDVACGTGNLIIEVIKQVNESNKFDIVNFIKNGNLYLYDIDKLAIRICIAKIELLLGESVGDYIQTEFKDFLSREIELPYGCSVITNPPYSLIKEFKKSWNVSKILKQSKDYYAGFMDKIMDYCQNAVIVSPQSFLVSSKFSYLRDKLGSNFTGEIFSFDNVPATLFNGRKHGIFNTNNANGVRASITSLKRGNQSGFRLTHLIRFKTEQRKEVMDLSFLRSKLSESQQDLKTPLKMFKELEPFINEISKNRTILISELIEEKPENFNDNFKLYVSTSARYFTVASKRELDRSGVFSIYAKDEKAFKLIYALIGSSYVYMWWRFYDGGILFTKRWLLKTPISVSLLNKVDDISPIIDEMIKNEPNYLSYKKNAGKKQESIKFPEFYRNSLNKILFGDYAKFFYLLHRNSEVNGFEKK